MIDKISTDDKVAQPIKLDTQQLQELDRLINSLKKEIVFPGKGALRKSTGEKAVNK